MRGTRYRLKDATDRLSRTPGGMRSAPQRALQVVWGKRAVPAFVPGCAGVLCAIVAPESVSRPTVWTAYPATQVERRLGLKEFRARLAELVFGWLFGA